jgi:predicted N-acetyltransferase YhbS
MNIRNARADDVNALIEIERVCFPPAEAAGPEALWARYAAFPECFFVAEEAGQVVGFVNGCAHDAPSLPDELYHDASLHRPDGAYQTVFGLDVLPEYRGRGVAAALLRRLIGEARARGCKGVVLTCKDHLKPYYEKFGFVCQGVSASTHGGAVWNDMLLTF